MLTFDEGEVDYNYQDNGDDSGTPGATKRRTNIKSNSSLDLVGPMEVSGSVKAMGSVGFVGDFSIYDRVEVYGNIVVNGNLTCRYGTGILEQTPPFESGRILIVLWPDCSGKIKSFGNVDVTGCVYCGYVCLYSVPPAALWKPD